MVDVILITETGAPIGPVSYYCTDQKHNLIVVDVSKSERGLSLQSLELSDGITITLLRPSSLQTISSAVCKALGYCNSQWVLVIDDATSGNIRNLATIRKIADTIPRLASIRQTNVPGIHPTQYNPLMGTLYSLSILRGIHSFPAMITDISVVAYTWAISVSEGGFVHVAAYVEDTGDPPAIVLPREVEDHLLEEKIRDSLVIPQPELPKGWMGSVKKRPWHYRVTVVIPHFGTDFRLLMNVIESWRLQKERPYILVYDTGTPPEHHASLRALASYDTEVHFCRWHGVRNIYDPVALAYNHGIIDCRTKYAIFTHNDLVPISQDVVGDLISLCCEDIPVVGYESGICIGLVGTQLTAAFMPVLDRVRVRWDILHLHTFVEEGFNECLKQAGIIPRFIGKEKRGRGRTPHFDHVGGFVIGNLYFRNGPEFIRVKADLDQVLEESEARLQVWRGLQ
jgi:hypothetical protein